MRQLVTNDLVGQRFGRLVVQEEYEIRYTKSKQGYNVRHVYVKCTCDCGNVKYLDRHRLLTGGDHSCGCLLHDCRVERAKALNRTHGETANATHPRLYNIWCDIKRRCCNPKAHAYERYGGRGIVVCDEWKDNYPAFKQWAMSHGYQDDLSIDRIDVNGNYEPDNCRWATPQVQANNRRSNVFYTHNGETHTIAEWSRITGIKALTIRARILNYGWSIERALTEPTNSKSTANNL